MTQVTIPQQLHNNDFGFVKLLPRSKKPFEKNWPDNPYSFTDIQHWLTQGNNYGVLGGYGSLVILDADSPELVIFVYGNLPLTFSVKTPKKGVHFYFLCKGIDKKFKLQKDNQDYGEIISFGSQVVGPGSIHPDTETAYTVEQDKPIVSINANYLLNALADYIPKQKNYIIENNNPEFISLVNLYGDPYYFDNKKKLTSINQAFWAGLHQNEHIQLFEPDERAFYRYNSETGLYSTISENAIKQEIASRILEVSRRQNLPKLERKRTNNILNHIVSQLKGISEKRDVFTKKQQFVHLGNGIVNFKQNGQADFIDFSPNFYSRNRSPIIFNPNSKCERFLNELLLPAVNTEDAIFIQKYAGLCLLGSNLIQRFMILDGMAGRGKSTLSLIIQKLVGLNNVTELRTRHLAERFELFRYRKKTLLIGIDVQGRFLSEKGVHVIKGLVGGDYFDAEQKCGTDSFQIQGTYCIIITSNSRLQVKLDGDLGAWKRRLLIVKFEGPQCK